MQKAPISTAERQRVIEQLRSRFANALGASCGGEGGRLFALVDLALCGVMEPEDQENLIRQARARGLLPEPAPKAAPRSAGSGLGL